MQHLKMGPLSPSHPLILTDICYCCQRTFLAGQYVTLVPLGPGDNPEERAKCRDGRPYNAISLPVHWSCATGEEDTVHTEGFI